MVTRAQCHHGRRGKTERVIRRKQGIGVREGMGEGGREAERESGRKGRKKIERGDVVKERRKEEGKGEK